MAAPGAGLLEDDSADVAIVGNSFVQPKYGFQAFLSNQMNRPVSLAWRGNNFGPYFTLVEYLKSPQFKRQRPKMLLWMQLEFDMQNMPNSSSWGQNAMTPDAFLGEVRTAVGA